MASSSSQAPREAPGAAASLASLPPDCLARIAELGFTQLSPLWDRGDLLGQVRLGWSKCS